MNYHSNAIMTPVPFRAEISNTDSWSESYEYYKGFPVQSFSNCLLRMMKTNYCRCTVVLAGRSSDSRCFFVALRKKERKVLYVSIPTMMAVDLDSGLKGQRLRPSSITTSPTSSLSSANVDVFWRQTANVPQAQSTEILLLVKSEGRTLTFSVILHIQ